MLFNFNIGRMKIISSIVRPVARLAPKRFSSYPADILVAKDVDSDVQRAERNRKKLLKLFPVVATIDGTDPEAIRNQSELFDAVEKEDPKAFDRLKRFLGVPNTTTGFMKRAGNAPHFHLVKVLDDVLREGLQEKSGFNDKKYGYRISAIPMQSDRECEAMWKVLNAVHNCGFSKQAKSKIFLNAKEDWTRNERAITHEFKDSVGKYATAIADDLILPAYIKEFQKKCSENIFYTPDRLIKFEDDFTSYIRSNLVDFVKDTLLSSLTPERLVGYCNRFDRMIPMLHKAKPVFATRFAEEDISRWHKIFPDQEINGVKFKVLTSDEELRKESDEVQNCVVSFSQRCHAGVCHIVSGVSSEGERFSVRFNQSNYDRIAMHEVNGISNKDVSQRVAEATDILRQQIDRREIKLNPKRGATDKDRKIKDAIGFDPLDQKSIALVFEAYRNARILPKEIQSAESVEQFYHKIGLEEFLTKRLPTDLRVNLEDRPSSNIAGSSAKCSIYSHREVPYLD